ncbi:MAG: metal ABC transporter permease [Gammaproteobacteria bacterium]|nr:metal ABC transporter permease [Gammaproteobacteria bacterium]
MSNFFTALFNYSFMQHAMLACLLASIGCGIIGTYVVVKRIGFLAGGIAHSVLAGMGIAYFIGSSPLAGAMIAALIAGILIGWINLHWRQHEDILIAAFWSVGMAIGILFISRTPGYSIDLMSYMFGNILLVSGQDLYLMLILDIVIIITVMLFYKQFLAAAFDEEFSRLRGINVEFFYILLLCMVALTVVLLIQIVGLILVLALLILPAATAAQFAGTIKRMMVVSIILSIATTTLGLVISYEPDLPSGATIIIVAGFVYVLGIICHKVLTQTKSV